MTIPLATPDWKLAKCKGADTELFFSKGEKVPAVLKEYCNQCPIQTACADFATLHHEKGIWGYTYRKRIAIHWHMYH